MISVALHLLLAFGLGIAVLILTIRSDLPARMIAFEAVWVFWCISFVRIVLTTLARLVAGWIR